MFTVSEWQDGDTGKRCLAVLDAAGDAFCIVVHHAIGGVTYNDSTRVMREARARLIADLLNSHYGYPNE